MSSKSASRVVLLTGGAGGIGSAIVASLLAAGHRVAAVDRDADGLKRLAAAHAEPDGKKRLHTVVEDLEFEFGCHAAVEAARSHFGPIEVVINNAGIGMSSIRPDAEAKPVTLDEMTEDIWDRFFAINVRAPMLITRAALGLMKIGKFGRIINVTTSYRTMHYALPYGATKAALESMSAILAGQLKDTGITVNVLIPGGPTDTPFIAAESGWPRDKMLKAAIMGPPAAWLISDEASGFTGQRIIAAKWDAKLPGADAAKASSRAAAWPELSADAVWLQG